MQMSRDMPGFSEDIGVTQLEQQHLQYHDTENHHVTVSLVQSHNCREILIKEHLIQVWPKETQWACRQKRLAASALGVEKLLREGQFISKLFVRCRTKPKVIPYYLRMYMKAQKNTCHNVSVYYVSG